MFMDSFEKTVENVVEIAQALEADRYGFKMLVLLLTSCMPLSKNII